MSDTSNVIDRLAKEQIVNSHEPSANETPPASPGAGNSRRAKWVFGGFAAVSLILLAVEHRTHVLAWVPSWWPWLFLLACPLMHIFMHGGHGGHGDHDAQGHTSNKADDK
jgi:hypothetical protein